MFHLYNQRRDGYLTKRDRTNFRFFHWPDIKGQHQQRHDAQSRRQYHGSPAATEASSRLHHLPGTNTNNSNHNTKSPQRDHRQMTNAMPIPAPIYFLVREQAKSLVAIKELKDRVKNLEQVQEEVFEAVHELRLDSDARILREASSYPGLVAPNSAMYGTNAKSSVPGPLATAAPSSGERPNVNRGYSEVPVSEAVSATTTSKKKEDFAKSGGDNDSENKQDSGVDSDCQIQMSLNPVPRNSVARPSGSDSKPEDADVCEELYKVLDDIETKSLRMRIHLHDQEQILSTSGALDDKTNVTKQLQLRDVRKENETLRKRAELAERYVEKLTFDRSLMDSKMEGILTEKKQLENTIHELHKRFVKSQIVSGKKVSGCLVPASVSEPASGPTPLEGSQKAPRLRSLEDSKSKMSNILKEKNVLELQRQLLAYILENEVLVTKVEEAEKQRAVSAKESEASQSKLRKNIDKLIREKNEFGKLYESKRRELDLARQDLSSARGKVGRLEKDLNAMNEFSETDPFFGGADRLDTNEATASFIDFSEEPSSKSKTKGCQSLPPVLYPPGHSRNFLKDLFSTDDRGFSEGNRVDDIPEEDDGVEPTFFDTRIGKGTRVSSFLSDDASDAASQTVKIRPSNLILDKSDLDSICSEFDPLSESGEGSKVDYEDSLNVNVSPPAKEMSRSSSRATRQSRVEDFLFKKRSEPRVKYSGAAVHDLDRYLVSERARKRTTRTQPTNLSQLLDLSVDEELL